jgi:hypothetical protein
MSSTFVQSQYVKDTIPEDVVYFTQENIINFDDTFTDNHMSLQLVSVPVEYNTEDGLYALFEKVLRIGKVESVRIIERKNYNQRLHSEIVTKTAFIDFTSWNNTSSVQELYRLITNNSNSSVRASSIRVITTSPIHWENGDNMTHLSLREARVGSGKVVTVSESSNKITEGLPLNTDDWNSLYIPILPTNMYIQHPDNTSNTFQPRQLKTFIENELNLGKVQRVDFIDRELEDSTVVKSVFIHFESWNNSTNAKFLREKLNTAGQFKQKGYYDGGMHRFMVRNDNGDKVPGYFVFKINYKPIPDVETTELNMSQLVAANKVLEEKMSEKDELIAKLTAELDELRKRLVTENGV